MSTITFHKRGSDGWFLTRGRDYQTQTRVFTSYCDPKTNNLYRDESPLTISKKAASLILFTPFYTGGAMVGNLLLGAKGKKTVLKAGYDFIKAPAFAALLLLSSCFTIGCPMQGRRWIDWTERRWHEVSVDNDIRHGMTREDIDVMTYEDFLEKVFEQERILFAGLCMQRVGNLNDQVRGKPRIVILPG